MATYVFAGYAIAVVIFFGFLFWKAMRQSGSASDRKRLEYEHRKGIGPTMERLVPPLVRSGPFVNQLRGNTSLAQRVVGVVEDAPSTWWGDDAPTNLPQAAAGCLAAPAVGAATDVAEADGDDQKPVVKVESLTCNADDSSPADPSAPETADPTASADVATEEEPERED